MFRDKTITSDGKLEMTMRIPRRISGYLGDRRETVYCRYKCRLQIRRLDPRFDKVYSDGTDEGVERQISQLTFADRLLPQMDALPAGCTAFDNPQVVEKNILEELPVIAAETLGRYQKWCIG